MTDSPRRHLLLPWTVQEREDPVLEFERGEGVCFFDRHGRRYLDFLSQLFHCNLGHGNRRVIEAIQRQAERTSCVSEDGVDPRRIARQSGRRVPGRKSLQVCGQAARTLAGALAASKDGVLRDLLIASVTPAPHAGRLLVTVTLALSAERHDPEVILQRLAIATGRLRTEVAAAVNRRKAPELGFRLKN